MSHQTYVNASLHNNENKLDQYGRDDILRHGHLNKQDYISLFDIRYMVHFINENVAISQGSFGLCHKFILWIKILVFWLLTGKTKKDYYHRLK